MSPNIFILTGAGVSAESGLGTFRDKAGEGIWSRFDPMKLATPEAFARDPRTVLAFYDARRRNLARCEAQRRPFRARQARGGTREARRPTDAGHSKHRRPARARRFAPRLPYARRIVEGALRALRDGRRLARRPAGRRRLPALRPRGRDASACRLVRRNAASTWTRFSARSRRADLFVAIGTSGAVYPAAGFVDAGAIATASRRWNSTSTPPTTPICSTTPATGRRARPFRSGSRRCWRGSDRQDESHATAPDRVFVSEAFGLRAL